MSATRHRRVLGLGALVLLAATHAHAGNPTRIQLVAEIPDVSISAADASGAIAGEVDGIATDALTGANPGEIIPGAQLHVSIPSAEGAVSWGHLEGAGSFVVGLEPHQ